MHNWRFFRAGGFDQVRLDSGADLMALEQLDQKLWVALACPTTGLEFDSRTLALMDTDKDGRIRAPELIAAVRWACACLKDPNDLLKGSAELPLQSINEASPDGKVLLASARHILASLGKPEAVVVTLADTADTTKILSQTGLNGDGIVAPDSAPDVATQAALKDILSCLGPDLDRSGQPGVGQAKVDRFFAEAKAYVDWWDKAEADPSILPLNSATVEAAAALKAVRGKIDDYFARCRLAAFDARAGAALNRDEKEYVALAAKPLNLASEEIAGFPLAQVNAGKPLPLRDGVNPAWADAMAQFEAKVVKPLLDGKSALQEADWAAICAKFAPYEAWGATKAGGAVEKLGLARVRELLGGPSRQKICELIAQDKALEPECNAIVAVERLVRYHRDLYQLINNFVSFRDFYSRKAKAVFQAGTLYLDQRSCELCIAVADPNKHAVMASLAGTYLAYCDCVRKGTGEQMQMVAAFTDGDSDNLMVGRNGIFYDRKGRDWDATITKILDNPISIRQAFWAPYKKAARMIQEQITKRATAADEAAVTQLAQASTALPKGPAAAAPRKIDPGLIAALGVGAAGLGGMVGSIIMGFLALRWMMPLGVLGVMLLISGPSMLLAWLKLHKRNLGPILDANGWAVNAKARINVPFGASLTRVAALPPGAQRDLVDPFADKKRPWGLYLTLIAIVALAFCWWRGTLDSSLPRPIKSTTVLGTNAPAYTPAPAPAPTNAPPAEAPKP